MNMAVQQSLRLVTVNQNTVTISPLHDLRRSRTTLITELEKIDVSDCAPPRTWVTTKKSTGKLVKRWETGRKVNGRKQVKEEVFDKNRISLAQWRQMELNRDRRTELTQAIDEITQRINRLETLFPEWSV